MDNVMRDELVNGLAEQVLCRMENKGESMAEAIEAVTGNAARGKQAKLIAQSLGHSASCVCGVCAKAK